MVELVASPIADPGVVSLIPVRPIFLWRLIMIHDIFSMVVLLPPLFQEYKCMCTEFCLTA